MNSVLPFLIIIVLLAGYIIFLHFQLARKNIYIESTIKHLAEIQGTWSTEEMIRFLQKMRKDHHLNSFFNDRLFEKQSLTFLLEDLQEAKTYIHYTREKKDADNIIREGFRFAESFYKTAMPVTADKLDLLIKHNGRKSYGDYIIIISIPLKLYEHYSSEIGKLKLSGIQVENILTDKMPVRNENGDLTYLVPDKFIKGYINHNTGEVARNSSFNLLYDSRSFKKNLEILMNNNVNQVRS